MTDMFLNALQQQWILHKSTPWHVCQTQQQCVQHK